MCITRLWSKYLFVSFMRDIMPVDFDDPVRNFQAGSFGWSSHVYFSDKMSCVEQIAKNEVLFVFPSLSLFHVEVLKKTNGTRRPLQKKFRLTIPLLIGQ